MHTQKKSYRKELAHVTVEADKPHHPSTGQTGELEAREGQGGGGGGPV